MSGRRSGKSPLQRGASHRRGRGWMLTVTVVILLVAVASWIVTYTGAVATAPATANTQTIDPGAIEGSAAGDGVLDGSTASGATTDVD